MLILSHFKDCYLDAMRLNAALVLIVVGFGCETKTKSPVATALCDLSKIDFPQKEGCRNDGSNELCVDREAVETVHTIFPEAICFPGGGRARCLEKQNQLLCVVKNGQCIGEHGEISNADWARLCQLSLLPSVRNITHTWFE
jgi:hypothetical protein